VIACADGPSRLTVWAATQPVTRCSCRLLWCCGLRIGEALVPCGSGECGPGQAPSPSAKPNNNRTRLVPLSAVFAAHAAATRSRRLVAEGSRGVVLPVPAGRGYNPLLSHRPTFRG